MNKLILLCMRIVTGLFPFIIPLQQLFRKLNYPKGIVLYVLDAIRYYYLNKHDRSFTLSLLNLYPQFFDRFNEAGEVTKHYFYQDIWAAKKVFQSGVKHHYDVGSRLDGFIAHCLVFTKVTMIDVRPLVINEKNLTFIQSSADSISLKTDSIYSLSSLHAVEHFGLGRYSDNIDPQSYIKAIDEYQRIVKSGGDIYFSTPIGKERLEFNSHRIFNPKRIISLFSKCKLIEFSVIDDNNTVVRNAVLTKYINANYSCGMYHFKKK